MKDGAIRWVLAVLTGPGHIELHSHLEDNQILTHSEKCSSKNLGTAGVLFEILRYVLGVYIMLCPTLHVSLHPNILRFYFIPYLSFYDPQFIYVEEEHEFSKDEI